MSFLDLLSSQEIARNISIYLFGSVVGLSFLRLVFCPKDNDRMFQKIIGGLGTFTVALISNNGWILLVSIFVGGLIIASEDFMKFLVAVLRSRSDVIDKTISALITKASPEEIREKRNEEVKLLKTEESSPENAHDKAKARLEILAAFEEKVHEFFAKRNPNYEKEIKIGDYNIVDGAIRNERGIIELIEIIIISSQAASSIVLRRALERLTFISADLKYKPFLRVAVVLRHGTLEEAQLLFRNAIAKFGGQRFKFSIFVARNNDIELIHES